MKINNKNFIKLLFTAQIIALLVAVATLTAIGLFFPAIFSKVQIIGYIFIIYNIIKIYGLKYIEYENSGEVLSIKRYSVFNKDIQKKQVEMPVENIKKIQLQKSFWNSYLVINVNRDDNREKRIHFPFDHMKRGDLLRIEETFKN